MTKKIPEGWDDPTNAPDFVSGMTAKINGQDLFAVRDHHNGTADILTADGSAYFDTDIVSQDTPADAPRVSMVLTAEITYELKGTIELQDE